MSTSDKKVTASRINGKKSPGPTNTTSTRFNATKHGLLAVGVTELDAKEGYYTTLRDLTREKNPVGVLETFLVHSITLDMVRWSRARRLEAEYITGVLNPPQREKDPVSDLDFSINGRLLDPGLPAALIPGAVQMLVNTFQRYEAVFGNRLFRTLHELERLQRMRQGERLPAPTAVDLSIPMETARLNSVPAASEQTKVVPIEGESLTVTLDGLHAETGFEDSAPAKSEPERVLSAEGENFAPPSAVDVTAGKTRIVDSAPTPWRPRTQPKAIWHDQ